MKLIEMNCKKCGATLSIDPDLKQGYCQYCGTKFFVDDEVKHIKYDDAEDAGYQFEKGRLRAQAEFARASAQPQQPVVQQPVKKSGSHRFWRVFGLILLWLYFFPIMFTITIAKTKMKLPLKLILIAALWILLIIICAVNTEETPDESSDIETSADVAYVEIYNEDLSVL